MSDLKLSSKILSSDNEKGLTNRLVSLKKELFNLRFQKALGELNNTSRFSAVKKDIARIKTELSKRTKVGA